MRDDGIGVVARLAALPTLFLTWHTADLNMVPLDTNDLVTAWLPLRSLSSEDAALAFASGSHRDFALPYWYDEAGMSSGLAQRGYPVESYSQPPLSLGDATWHAGWTLHSAPGQPATSAPRVALAVSYFADGARRLPARCACLRCVALRCVLATHGVRTRHGRIIWARCVC